MTHKLLYRVFAEIVSEVFSISYSNSSSGKKIREEETDQAVVDILVYLTVYLAGVPRGISIDCCNSHRGLLTNMVIEIVTETDKLVIIEVVSSSVSFW